MFEESLRDELFILFLKVHSLRERRRDIITLIINALKVQTHLKKKTQKNYSGVVWKKVPETFHSGQHYDIIFRQ